MVHLIGKVETGRRTKKSPRNSMRQSLHVPPISTQAI